MTLSALKREGMSAVRVLSWVAVVAAVWLAPAAAWACPQCAANNDAGPTTLLLVAAMIFLPWLVAWVVYRVVKRSGIFSTESSESGRPTA